MPTPARTSSVILRELRAFASPERAKHNLRFFKTGPGEYGEGDRFLGLSLPQIREVLRRGPIDREECLKLLDSPWHEARLVGVLGLVRLSHKGTPADREEIAAAYLARSARVNNWDLVDASAAQVVGPVFCEGRVKELERLARSKLLWDRRIAMIATFHATRRGDPKPALRIAKILLGDREDLIHKAVGWMLREVGQRVGLAPLREFLDRHAATMPRTALRYAIEKLSPAERARFMARRAP